MSTQGFFGVTAEQLADARRRDLEIHDAEDVNYEHAWLGPETGKVLCLATGPSTEAVMPNGATPQKRSLGRRVRARL